MSSFNDNDLDNDNTKVAAAAARVSFSPNPDDNGRPPRNAKKKMSYKGDEDSDDDKSGEGDVAKKPPGKKGKSASKKKNEGGNGAKKPAAKKGKSASNKESGGGKGEERNGHFAPPNPLPKNILVFDKFDDVKDKGDKLPLGTIEIFKKKGISIDEEEILNICKSALVDGYTVVVEFLCDDFKIPVGSMSGEFAKERGLYVLWLVDGNKWKVGAVSLLSSSLEKRVSKQLLDGYDDPKELSLILATLPVLRSLAEKKGNGQGKTLWDWVDTLIEKAHTFTVHDDHEDQNRDEVLIFLMEYIFSACIEKVQPGYILERFLPNGSQSMQNHLKLPSQGSNTFLVDVYKELKNESSRLTLFHTWETIMSAIVVAMQAIMLTETSIQLRQEAAAMFSAAMNNYSREGGYLQMYLTRDFSWQGGSELNEFRVIDAVDCPIFKRVREILEPLVELIDGLAEEHFLGEEGPLYSKILSILKSLSKIKMEYKRPEDLGTKYNDALAKLRKELKESPFGHEVVEIEKIIGDTIKSKTIPIQDKMNQYRIGEGRVATNAVGEDTNNKCYQTVIEGSGKKMTWIETSSTHTILSIQSGGSDWNARTRSAGDLAVLIAARLHAGLLDKDLAERDLKILKSSLINADPENDIGKNESGADDKDEYDDYEDDDDEDAGDEKKKKDGRQIVSYRKALPKGYLLGKHSGPGIKQLADVILPGLDAYHVTAMMAVMGYSAFLRFIHLWRGLVFNPPSGETDLPLFFRNKFYASGVDAVKAKVFNAMDKMDSDAPQDEVTSVAIAIREMIEKALKKLRHGHGKSSYNAIMEAMREHDEGKANALMDHIEGNFRDSFQYKDDFSKLHLLRDEEGV